MNESSGYKTIAGVAAKVDKDGKIVDEKVKKKIEQRIGKSLDEEKELLVENDYVKDIVYESFLCEVDQIKYDDVSDMKVFKLDNDNACVIFKYEDKYHIQGVQKGDEDVNLEVGDKETVDAYIGRLKEAGFEEKSVSKEDMQKQFDKISEDFINENSQIFEKIGDRKKFSKHEERVGNTIRRGDKKIAGYNFPNFVSDKENNDANKKVGQKLGGKLVSTAAKGAIVKGLASKGILTGLIGAGVTGSKSVAGAALAVKVCTAIPMAGFGGLALAGVGVAAGATIAHKIVKKNIEKAETNVNRGYKTSWGRYFKKDGNEWVQIDKDEYNKLKEKDQKANESKKVVEAFITESDIKGISKEKVLDIAGIDVKKTGKDDIKKSIKKLLKVSESVNEDDWITIRGTHTLVDGDGNIKNDKLKKKIEATSKGKSEKSTGSSSVKIDKGRISKSKKSFRDKLSKMSADDFDGDRLAEDFKSMSDEIDEVAKNSIKDDEFASELYDSPMFGLAVTALVSNISADDVDKMSDGDVKETLGIDDASSDEIKSLKKSMKSCINGFMAVASEPNIDYSDDEDTVLKKSKDNVLKKADGLDEMLCSKAELASTLSSIHKRYSGNS